MVEDGHHQQQQQQGNALNSSETLASLTGGNATGNSQILGNSSSQISPLPPPREPLKNDNARQSLAPAKVGNVDEAATKQHQHHRETFSSRFPSSKKSILSNSPLISQEKFHWDQTEQGHILGAFFYGYILFQIPGARMAELVGARWILMAATAGSAFISLIFPLSTQLNSIHLIMVLRFVMGLCQSAFFPAAYVFYCRWLPEQERSILLPIMFIGSNMGSISTYIMSSYLISSSYGWPSVFYLSGLICLFVTLLWFIFGSNNPSDNWLITNEERVYIMENVNNGLSASTRQCSKNEIFDTVQMLPLSTSSSTRQQQQQQQQSSGSHKSKLILEKKCDRIATTARGSNALSARENGKCLNKSKSANDLIISLPQQTFKSVNFSPKFESNQKACANPCQIITKTNTNGINITNTNTDHNAQQLCWRKLLSSLPIWVLILSMYGNEWSQVVLMYELPTYLNTALNFPIEQNGVINSFFQLSYTIASPIISSLGAYMLDGHLLGMRKIHVRKLFQSLATFGQLACFMSVPICGSNRGLIILFMFSATVFKACANAGDIMVAGDLSPEYAGTIFAFANSIGNTAGFFVPLLAGFIVNNPYEREQWTPFWLTTATIMGCSGMIFLIFGETKRQNFSADPEDNEPNDCAAAVATGSIVSGCDDPLTRKVQRINTTRGNNVK